MGRTVPPSPQYDWPLLSRRVGATVWVKHENHLPTGAFKVRGGVTYIDWLRRTQPGCTGVVTATRGNHGQSIARAATAAGLAVRIFVPPGNAVEKTEAMRAYGAEIVVAGTDYDSAREAALGSAESDGWHFIPSFHPELVRGVATGALELFDAVPDLDTLYCPIGAGSGVCAAIAARDALGRRTRIVGVVSRAAPTALLSRDAGRPVPTDTARTFADGIAVRMPVPAALAVYGPGCDRIVAVGDDAIAEAIRVYFADTHSPAEGAGAAPLAALLAEAPRMAGRTVGVMLCGGNIDSRWMAEVLAGRTPRPE